MKIYLLLLTLLSRFLCSRVHDLHRNLAIFCDFRFGVLAHLGEFLEINGQCYLIEYMDSGLVNNFALGPYEELKASVNSPTDCSFLAAEDCELCNTLREASRNDSNCFEFQNSLWTN
jgi:hypothetical protein